MGTPEFAVESLRMLVENQVNIVAVITAPDKPKGRGKKLGISPVKEYAQSKGLAILQPTNLKDEGFLQELAAYEADLQIVVAFRMLPVAVWDMPTLGTFNLHASLLPQYRGAAPINWAIINGERETGITTFFLKHEIDTGKIIFQEKISIGENENVGELYERLMQNGAELVLKTVEAIAKEDYPQIDQNEDQPLKPAPKIFRNDCEINWHKPAQETYNFIRGLSPYPAAWSTLNGRQVKVLAAEKTNQAVVERPGIWSSDEGSIFVSTRDHLLRILELQLEGKKRMTAEEFLRGNSI
ncbi:MAG: methionyl-tRNA formyltransferase [Cyclobacteriaceae bacterium]|nr:methionyl-tRNA formyltransferase [Cyclobacteriaceae bacterium HetDA_MAG_MS6]